MSLNKSFPEEPLSTPRGKRRIRKAAVTGVTALVAKSSTTVAGFISIPLTASYLGIERFGIWLTLSTLLSWISLADFGLANSLKNVIATADSQNDSKEAISSAFWMMVTIGVLLVILFILIYPWIDWNNIFNVSSSQIGLETELAVFIGFLFFVLRLPLSIFSKIYDAYQEGYFYQLWAGIGGWISLIALIVGIKLKVGLHVLVGIFFGSSLFADIFSMLHLLVWRRPNLKPSIRNFRWLKSWELIKTGIQFLIVQASAIALYQTDLIIVTQLFGSNSVASYGVSLKLFSIIGVVQSAFLAPLWPAYSEAFAKKDAEWIINTFKYSTIVSLAWSISCGIMLFYFSPWIINSWVGKQAIPSNSLLLSMLIASVLASLGQCMAYVLNGLGELRSQVIIATIAGIINLIISIVLGKLIGIVGVTWGTIISVAFGITLVGKDTLENLRRLRKLNQI